MSTLRIATVLAIGLLIASCAASVPPPRLFVLSPVKALPAGDHPVSGISILVAQAQIPDYLDRPQIVERTTANELKLVEADHWGERLSINISRVVAQNLSAMVPGDANVSVAARSALPYDYQVVLTLNNFELDQSGAAVLGGRWSVTNAEGTKELAAATVSLRQPAARPGIVAAVEAMNANLGVVCRDIAVQIRKLGAPAATK